MSARLSRRPVPLVTVLTAALVWLAVPADAAPVEVGASVAQCSATPAARTAGREPDGPTYTLRQLRLIDRNLEEALTTQRVPTTRNGLELRIAVHVHVIRDADTHGPSETRVRRQLDLLTDAYAGGQSAESAPTSFTFRLASFERVRNDRWYKATMGSDADQEMRRALHRGGIGDLNLYLLNPRDPAGQGVVLGWSSSPWQAAENLRLDGVSVHQGSLPGGSLQHYDRGDTAVHEVGHWLGLLHTFEGGCSEPNDLVADTPAEGQPSTTCEGVKDTCELEGDDPVHNFMDYAVDACMDMFTPGQAARMTDNWLAYRTP